MGTRQDQTLGTDIRRNNSFLELFTFSVSLSSMKNNEMLALFTSTVLFLFDHVQPICHVSWPLLLKQVMPSCLYTTIYT